MWTPFKHNRCEYRCIRCRAHGSKGQKHEIIVALYYDSSSLTLTPVKVLNRAFCIIMPLSNVFTLSLYSSLRPPNSLSPFCLRVAVAALSSDRNTEAATPWALRVIIIVCALTSKMASLSLQGCAHTASTRFFPTNLWPTHRGKIAGSRSQWTLRLALTDPFHRLVVIFAYLLNATTINIELNEPRHCNRRCINKLWVSRIVRVVPYSSAIVADLYF